VFYMISASSRKILAAIGVVVLLALAGCTSSSQGKSAPGSPASRTTTPSVDACTILSPATVAALVGGKAQTSLIGKAPFYSDCRIEAAAGPGAPGELLIIRDGVSPQPNAATLYIQQYGVGLKRLPGAPASLNAYVGKQQNVRGDHIIAEPKIRGIQYVVDFTAPVSVTLAGQVVMATSSQRFVAALAEVVGKL